jgi:aspartyl-tRNA(Asn)/glutamyl-tRNA(Gln) amidotransferase subunit C
MSDDPTPEPSAGTGAASRISTADVAKVAKLARLRLSDEELDRFTHQLADILDHATDMESLDLDGVEPMARPIPLSNVFRADEPGPLLDRREVLAAAPAVEDEQFRVPPSLGEES